MSLKVIVTYCSGPKRNDDGVMPAIDRYLSERIRTFHQQATEDGDAFRVLSGEFGLLAADQPIPWYDHLLQPEEIGKLAQDVAAGLADLQAEAVEYYTADPARFPEVAPYREVIEAACRAVGIDLEVKLLSGDPD